MTQQPSQFFWYDVMTTDVAAAERFYTHVVGWTAADSGVPGQAYTVLSAAGEGVAGIMATPEGAAFPPIWTGYIHSGDVDADVARAMKRGGTLCRPPTGIPGVGRFAVVADPHGAMFNLMKPEGSGMASVAPPGAAGHIGWRELHAGDGAAAWAFYEAMFGWTKAQGFDMGPMGTYQTFATGGDAVGGMMTRTADMPKPCWLFYFNVDAIDAAAARIAAAGGRVLMGPHEVPTGQWIVQGADPQGALFGLVAPRR